VFGLLLLDKPLGLSSNRALQRAKRLFGAAKAGHAGSLDPLATGMLPIFFGAATRLAAFMLEARKTYRVVAKLGVATTTGDAEGETIAECLDAPPP
jgi:tRNA pseudouridine55 synthase